MARQLFTRFWRSLTRSANPNPPPPPSHPSPPDVPERENNPGPPSNPSPPSKPGPQETQQPRDDTGHNAPPDIGAYSLDPPNAEDNDEAPFNFSVARSPGNISVGQSALHKDIYGVWGTLLLLLERGIFTGPTDPTFSEYRRRIIQAGRAGLVGPYPKTDEGSIALKQIRDNIAARKGRQLKYRYLLALAGWASFGILSGFLLAVLVPSPHDAVASYGWVLIGSMVGAWMSIAATRRQISFDDMPNYLDRRIEPIIRLLFVALLSASLSILVHLGVIDIAFGSVNLKDFSQKDSIAGLLGLVCGLGEKAVTVRVIDRFREVLGSGGS